MSFSNTEKPYTSRCEISRPQHMHQFYSFLTSYTQHVSTFKRPSSGTNYSDKILFVSCPCTCSYCSNQCTSWNSINKQLDKIMCKHKIHGKTEISFMYSETINDGQTSNITRHKTPTAWMAFELRMQNTKTAKFRSSPCCVAVNEVQLEAVTPSFDKPRFRLYPHWGSLHTRVLLGTTYSANREKHESISFLKLIS